eukprot:TRINITY_DN4994_c0_g1_i1.p1 TRINITY_DN4994_c0_g1~~TRINITY_DN4994_c0_g1_i1.p1  ORF type:complete len:227 (-),score=70.99 TRINITY_DN4994_c0_g1_i1:80-760(-)
MDLLFHLLWLTSLISGVLCLLFLFPSTPIALKKQVRTIFTQNKNDFMFYSISLLSVFAILLFFDGVRDLFEARSASSKAGEKDSHSSHDRELHLQIDSLLAQRNILTSLFSVFISISLYYVMTLTEQVEKTTLNMRVLQKQASNQLTEFNRLTTENENLKKQQQDQQNAIDDAKVTAISSEGLKKQAENQQTQFLKLIEENTKLMKLVDQLEQKLADKNLNTKKNE